MEIKIEIDENELNEIVIQKTSEKLVSEALRTNNVSLERKYAADMLKRQIYDTVQKFFSDNKEIIEEMIKNATRRYIDSSSNAKNGKLRKMIEEFLKEEEE